MGLPEKLWDLQSVYQKLARFRFEKKKAEKKLADLNKTGQSSIEQELAQSVELKEKTAKERRGFELELETVLGHEKEVQKKIYDGSVSSPRELAQLEQKLADYQHQQAGLEEKMLVLMESAEESDKKVAALTDKIASRERDSLEAKKNLQKELLELDKQIAVVEDEFNKIWFKLSPDEQEFFQKLYKQYSGHGVARVDNDVCGGCQVSLSSSTINKRLVKTGMVYCDNCGRLLCE